MLTLAIWLGVMLAMAIAGMLLELLRNRRSQ